MRGKKTSKNEEFYDLPETLIRSFWAVFTLPFRTVRFIYRRLSEIPLRNLLLMSLIFIGLVAVTLVVLLEATSTPGFCVSCHYMKPYFKSWQESTHSNVHCTECHFPPGIQEKIKGKFTAMSMVVNYFTGVYKKSKPWAEISDEACLREGCHQTRLLEGKVPFKEGIIFDHTPHLTEDRRGKNLRCTSCHSQIVQGSHMKVTEETCFLCHFKDQKPGAKMTSCTFCHDAPVANDSVEVVFDHTYELQQKINCRLCHGNMAHGDGDVPRERCSYCHAEVGKLEYYSETKRIHEIHITEHKVECNRCHNTITHQSIARTGKIKPDCQACHIDRHLDQYNLFSGQGAVGVDPMPSTMFHAGLSCKACHVLLPADWEKHPGKATSKAGPASCQPCHGDGYYKLYEQAKPVLRNRITALKRELRSLRARMKSQKADSVLTAVDQNLKLVENAIPIHNLGFTDRILTEAKRSLDRLEGKEVPPLALPDTTSARCLRCHFGQDQVTVQYNNKAFSHHNHVHNVNLGCKTCHIEEKPNHGKLHAGPFCMACHHKSAAVSCDPCHKSQRDLIEANGPFIPYDPDVMHEAGLSCRDCHEVTGKQVNRPTASTCETCHEPGYWDELVETRVEISRRLAVLEKRLKGLPESSAERTRATELIQALKADGTMGAHNIIAALDVLDNLEKILASSSESKSSP
jgi:nitrate/TMAO reductase-like tetraheme cytochrome c subunit